MCIDLHFCVQGMDCFFFKNSIREFYSSLSYKYIVFLHCCIQLLPVLHKDKVSLSSFCNGKKQKKGLTLVVSIY